MDVYAEVTARIITELEKGAAPWIKPWKAGSSPDHNLISKKPYQGINRILLAVSSMANGYNSPTWATYKQFTECGHQVQKGEKATHIVFFKPVPGKVNAETGETESSYCVIRSYSVFNADQTSMPKPEPVTDVPAFNPLPECEQFMARTGASISHGGDTACYIPSQDRIQLPHKTAFDLPSSYYATAFHELVHWSGADHRLDRKLNTGRFGDPAYAFEELVAEIGAAFLCTDHAITGELRHAGYIGHWLKACKEDSKAIFKASALAQKAANYLKGLDVSQEQVAA